MSLPFVTVIERIIAELQEKWADIMNFIVKLSHPY